LAITVWWGKFRGEGTPHTPLNADFGKGCMMSGYPSSVNIFGQEYTFHRLLKDDFFSLNILYTNPRNQSYVLKLSDFRFVGGWLFRPLAAWISRREYTIYQMVADIPGVPALGPQYGNRGYFHLFIEGKTLHEIEREIIERYHVSSGNPAFGTAETILAPDFFEQLQAILHEVHRRRIFYVDLNKRGNIICSTKGKPYLIDFQICVHIPTRQGWLGSLTDKIFKRLKQEDFYHLYKHKKTFQPQLMTEAEQQLAKRSKLSQRYRQFLWRPYITVKRLIYPHGSNETIWYKWKKEKDQSPRMS
jgi:hypothetical protein